MPRHSRLLLFLPYLTLTPYLCYYNYKSIPESRDIIKSAKDRCNLIWAGKDSSNGLPRDFFCTDVQKVFARPLFTEENIFSQEESKSNLEINNYYYFGDNLDVLQHLSSADEQPGINLIYIDPPYMSQIKYNAVVDSVDESSHTIHAFEDRWGGNHIDAYLNMLYPRLLLMHRVLDRNGSIFVHVDWHVSHYVRLLLDEIFGREQFVNEIIWCYSGGSNTRRNLQRKHDTILWYSRSQTYTFNPPHRPYTQGTLERGLTASKGGRYQLSEKGAILQDWWTDINKILSPTAYENLKYPTQKPKKLLERIILMASHPGDLVADFFGGSATTADACNETGRSWLLCDNSKLAVQTTLSRLIKSESPPFMVRTCRNAGDQDGFSKTAADIKKQAVLRMKKPVLQENSGEACWLSLGIDFYQPADLPDQWDASQFASYIDFWEIDPDYDGTIFSSQYQLLRNQKRKQPAPLTFLFAVPKKKNYTMAIKLYDVFANQMTARICFAADSRTYRMDIL